MNPLAMQNSFMMGASGGNSSRGTFTSIFLAALLSSSKYQDTPMDLWGNAKMPTFSSIENSTSDEWKIVPDDSSSYASLIGIPVAYVQSRETKSNFTIKARQWDARCDKNKLQRGKEADFGNKTKTYKLNHTTRLCAKYPC